MKTKKGKASSIIELIIIAVSLLLLLPAISFADDSAASTAELLAAPSPSQPSVKGSFSVSRSNSLYIVNGDSAVASWDFSGSLSKELPQKIKLSAILEGSQDIKNPEDSDLSRGRLILGKAFGQLTPKLTFSIPVSRAQNSASYQGGLSFGVTASANPDSLPSKKLSLSASVSLGRSFHKYETGVNGRVNSVYGSTQALVAGWDFTDKLSLSLEFDHVDSINYQNRLSESYVHIQEVAYALNPQISLALGHQYGNPSVSSLKADEQTLNYNLTDEDNSIAYGTMTLSF
jgi:hypothetical protein